MEIKCGKMAANDVRRQFREVMEHVADGHHVVVTRSGKEMVALIPISDFEALAGALEDLQLARDVGRQAQLAALATKAPAHAEPIAEGALR